jgi:ABC-2 type transport system permease protein
MLRGLWRLTWLEIKIFAREPLGLFGSMGVPVIVFAVLGRLARPLGSDADPDLPPVLSIDLPVFGVLLVALSAVLSLAAIISIYREGGILKRLKATPLRPYTILTAHVIVKLLATAFTVALMILAGRRYYPIGADVPLFSFGLAVLLVTASILSLGFLIASLVPTARFAQPIGTFILYPMLALSGLFLPVESLPPALRTFARLLPLTPAVSLLRGIWRGEGWWTHAGEVATLVLMFTAFTWISSRVFRWE